MGFRCSTTLLNPVVTTAEKHLDFSARPSAGPVTYVPVIALGLTTRNRGGWYVSLIGRWRASGDAALDVRLQEQRRMTLLHARTCRRRWNRDRKRRSTPAISLSAFTFPNDELADGGVSFHAAGGRRPDESPPGQAAVQGDDLSQPRQGQRQGCAEQLPHRLGVFHQ